MTIFAAMEDLSHILLHLGEDDFDDQGSVVPPLVQTANFAYPNVQAMRDALQNEEELPLYTRGLNPTTALLANKLSAIEGTEAALLTSSGSAAVAKAVLSVLKHGDHLVSVHKPYSWTGKLMTKFLPRFGIQTTFVDGTQMENFKNAIQPNTRLIYLESPNSFTFELQDIAAVAALAKNLGIHTIIDNSYCTGVYQKPALMGIDTVVHSATKYYSGHSDVVAGVICSSKAHISRIFKSEFMTLGGVLAPFNAWLLLKGLRTLDLRLERSSESTSKIVDFLLSHPKIETVYWPGHPGHAQYALAQKQMSRASGLFSLVLKSNQEKDAFAFAHALKRFRLAVSWGSYESLQYPAVVAHGLSYGKDEIPVGLFRMAVGLEPVDILIGDLEQALDKI